MALCYKIGCEVNWKPFVSTLQLPQYLFPLTWLL